MKDLENNGFTITVDVAVGKDCTSECLIKLENGIAKVIEENGYILLGGKGEFRRFKEVDVEIKEIK